MGINLRELGHVVKPLTKNFSAQEKYIKDARTIIAPQEQNKIVSALSLLDTTLTLSSL
jgi:hypothetical protein